MMLTSGMCLSFFGLSVALLYYVETRNWSIYSISHNFRRSVFLSFSMHSIPWYLTKVLHQVRYQPCEDIHLNIHEDIDLYHQTPIQTIWGLFDWHIGIARYTPLNPGYAIRLARSPSTPYIPDQ